MGVITSNCLLLFTGVGSAVSLVLSLLMWVLIFGGMQMYKSEFASGEWKTIVGGFLGSWLFIFGLTVSILCNHFEKNQSSLVIQVRFSKKVF